MYVIGDYHIMPVFPSVHRTTPFYITIDEVSMVPVLFTAGEFLQFVYSLESQTVRRQRFTVPRAINDFTFIITFVYDFERSNMTVYVTPILGSSIMLLERQDRGTTQVRF